VIAPSKFGVAILALMLCALGAAGCGNLDADPLEAARRAVKDRDPARAVGLYQRYLEDHPDDFEVLKEYTLTLGERWAFEGGDRRPIIENLERLYAMRPSDQDVQGLLSVMLVREGQAAGEAQRFEEAESAFRRAISANPESGAAQYHLGVLYDDRDDGDRAFAQYRAAAAKRPQIPDLYLRLGNAYLDRGDLDRAITTFGLVVELSGVSTYLLPRAHCSLARAYAGKSMAAEAAEHLDLAGDACEIGGGGPTT